MHRQVIRAKQVTTGYVGDSKMALPENGRKLYHCRHQRSLQVTESHLRLSCWWDLGSCSATASRNQELVWQSASDSKIMWSTVYTAATASDICLSFI